MERRQLRWTNPQQTPLEIKREIMLNKTYMTTKKISI